MIARLGNIPVQIVSGGRNVAVLPNEYHEVEYLKSNGNQYIDINYTYQINDEIECEFSKDENSGGIQGVFGNGNKGNYIGAVLYINAENILTVTIGGLLGANFFKWENNPLTLGQKYSAKITGNKLYVDGNLALKVINTVQNGTQQNFSLFRRWNTLALHGKIYKMSIKRNGEYLFNFVNCYRKSDNVAGMYDLANGVFYTNAGTGEFITGPSIVYPPLTKTVYKINL